MKLVRVALAISVASFLAACGSSTHAESTSRSSLSSTPTVPGASGNLYRPPSPLPLADAGTLIRAQRVTAIPIHPPATIWRILYHSRSRSDRDIAVSGFAIVPKVSAPAGGRNVYAWAHGTVGLGDQCAPSHGIRDALPPFGGQQLERGAALVATNYEGLGTPGVPTSTVGPAEGHAVLDSIRAVAGLPDVGTLGDVVLAGHSQGGQAALFAGEVSPTYAPELHVVGIAALAPGVELPALVDHLASSPAKATVLMGAIGLHAAYPDLDLATVFTPDAIADIPRSETECVDTTVARYASTATSELIARDPSTVPDVERILEANSPGATRPMVPVFLGHGTFDEQVPVELSARLRTKYCAVGASVDRRTYAGEDHMGVIDAASADVLAFITDVFEHQRPENRCRPSTG
jgi:pimeloyl-ACP methyl ester carboxylesterase